MKALVLSKPGQLSYEELPNPVPEKGEALIRVKHAGICGSDVLAYLGRFPWGRYPIVLGHEVAGEVVEINPEEAKRSISIGDKVVIDPVVECGRCYPCRIGRYNCCSNMKILGIDFNGGFAQYLTMPLHRLYAVPKGMRLERAVLCEPLSIGAQATGQARLHPRDFVAIIGGGPIGLCTLLIAKAIQDVEILVMDILPERLSLAKRLGASYVIDPAKTNWIQTILDFTNGEGANVVIEASGKDQGMEMALQIASAGSRIVVLGQAKESVSFIPASLVKKEMSIIASRLNTNLFPKVLEILDNPGFQAEMLVSQRGDLGEASELLRLAAERPQDVMKIIISQ